MDTFENDIAGVLGKHGIRSSISYVNVGVNQFGAQHIYVSFENGDVVMVPAEHAKLIGDELQAIGERVLSLQFLEVADQVIRSSRKPAA
jgi:hypothetical protein